MVTQSILWTLLLITTVRARSEVNIADAVLNSENASEESALKTDVNSQNNADIEEAILSRIGLDVLHENDGVNLEKTLDEKLQETLSRLSGMEPNDVSDTNYDTLANLKTGMASNEEVYNQRNNLRNDNVLNLFAGGADDVSVLSAHNRGGRLNFHGRNSYNLNPFNIFHSRSSKLLPYVSVRNSGLNTLNINEKDPNTNSASLLTRVAALNGVKESKLNNLNNLLLTRRLISRLGLGKNDLENGNVNADESIPVVDELMAHRRSFVNTGRVNKNSQLLNVRKNLALNNLGSHALHENNLNSDIDTELANIAVQVRAGSNGLNEFNKITSLDLDDSSVVNVLDHLSKHGNLHGNNKHGIRKLNVNLNDLHPLKIALNNLDSNTLNTKTGSIDVDRELASIIVNVRGANQLNELNKVRNLDDSNDVNVFGHVSKHGLTFNRNGIGKVSLNDLNDAKRLIGPLSLDEAVADRVSNEVDGALLNALKAEDNFNALGALIVLNKAAAVKALENSLELNGRSGDDVESNLLSKLGIPEDAEVNGVTNNNPLDEVVNNLVALSRIDSTNNLKEDVHLDHSPENLSRSHKSLLHDLVSDVDEVDDVDSLQSRASNWWNRKRKFGVPTKRRRPYRPGRLYRPYRLHKRYRPVRQRYLPVPLYRSRLSSGLNNDESVNDLVELSKLANLNDVVNVRNEENEYSLDDLLPNQSGLSAVSADQQLKNLVALRNHVAAQVHARNHLGHVSEEEESVRQSVSNLDKDLRDAKNLLLTGNLGNLNEQRRKLSGKQNVVLVPLRVERAAALNEDEEPYEVSDLINLDDNN